MDIELFDDKISQGINLMTAENYEAAKDCFEAAIKMNPKSVDAYNHLGNAFANLRLYDKAISTFQKILIIEPANAEAYFSIANIHVLKEEKLKAVECYNKAEKAGYESSQMYQILASIFFEADDAPQALRNITRAINITPFDGELRLFKARIYLAFDRYNEALDTLDEMERVLPDAYEVYDLKAQIYSGLEKYEDALECANRGRDRFPEDINLAMTKLRVLVTANLHQEAYELISELKDNGMYEKSMKDASIHEATLLIKEEKIDDAYHILLKCNNKLPEDSDILYLLLDLCGKTGMYDKVILHSEELMKLNCGDFYLATALFFHATALEEVGEKDRAQSEFKVLTSRMRKFTINNPSFYEGYLYRLLSHVKIGEYDKALELADYIHNLYPEKADAHAFKYFIYKEMGDTSKAQEEKDIAKRMNPELDIQ